MENYFFDTEESPGKGLKYYVLVIYDISNNKRRNNLSKIMKSFGFRVQKSAFEARLSESKYNKMLKKIESIVAENDNIRIYKLRGNGAVTVLGKDDDEIDDEGVIII
ncbi:MAG: CRISPR-associated endonuclease Cas2 [Oscillospiraceae bacterium]|nr:CRISPR-associated endonuclease Cas2 [Oscillospiraceae bacterium]